MKRKVIFVEKQVIWQIEATRYWFGVENIHGNYVAYGIEDRKGQLTLLDYMECYVVNDEIMEILLPYYEALKTMKKKNKKKPIVPKEEKECPQCSYVWFVDEYEQCASCGKWLCPYCKYICDNCETILCEDCVCPKCY